MPLLRRTIWAEYDLTYKVHKELYVCTNPECIMAVCYKQV